MVSSKYFIITSFLRLSGGIRASQTLHIVVNKRWYFYMKNFSFFFLFIQNFYTSIWNKSGFYAATFNFEGSEQTILKVYNLFVQMKIRIVLFH